ncbi:MAG: DNA replication and repair protein RecF [Lentisphaeria bacterium]|nr:DNA replication and repair protein RecF [Lentisphaerota bacterium]MBR7145307.1 DNA replication and repair protein RecF [Lentisphaeria bacterium]
MIGEFRALNWRSFERTHWFFEEKNLLVGCNGSGKSNLLEALGFLGILRSFRTAKISELIRNDTQEFHLRGVWQESKSKTVLETGMTAAGERLLLVNGSRERSGRDFIRHFFPVVFAPEDMEIVSGTPGVRRRFFDMTASQISDSYVNILHDYIAALKLRNMLLKNPRKIDLAKLEAYEGLMAFAAAELTERRQKFIMEFNRMLSALAPSKAEQISIEYHPQCSAGAESYLALFARNRGREMEKRTTLTGCHLDDYRFCLAGRIMRGFASNGQNRMAALNSKLAAARMLMQNHGAEKLVALVDDVTGELDKKHREMFFETIAPSGQLFFTYTSVPDDRFFKDAKVQKITRD